jgi:hypothetical protein
VRRENKPQEPATATATATTTATATATTRATTGAEANDESREVREFQRFVYNRSWVYLKGGFEMAVGAAPHPRRPLGSPIFAYGDLKEKFAFLEDDNDEEDDDEDADDDEKHRRGGKEKEKKKKIKLRLSVPADYGPRRARTFPKDPNQVLQRGWRKRRQ